MDTLDPETRASLTQLNPEQMEKTVLEMMGALQDNTGYNEVQDMENPMPTDEELAQTLQMGENGQIPLMEGQTSVGRNAVEQMEKLEQIGGART